MLVLVPREIILISLVEGLLLDKDLLKGIIPHKLVRVLNQSKKKNI